MDYLTDYISNPKSTNWNQPEHPYNVVYLQVRKEIKENQKNVFTCKMQCRTQEQPYDIAAYWNKQNDGYTYIIVKVEKRTE